MLIDANRKNEQIFRCEICDYVSNRKNNLKRHFVTERHRRQFDANLKICDQVMEGGVIKSKKHPLENVGKKKRAKNEQKKKMKQRPLIDGGEKNEKNEKNLDDDVATEKHPSNEHNEKSSQKLRTTNYFLNDHEGKKTNEQNEQKTSTLHYWCKCCNKKYKHPSSFSRHLKKCKKKNLIIIPQKRQNDYLLLENTKLKDMNKFLLKKLENMNSNINELKENVINIAHIQADTNKKMKNINITNNKMSINIYLNEYCKDAMNLTDFLNTINISLDDLLYTKNHGYVKGIGKIFEKQLLDLKPTQRPIHCSDKKRMHFYVKDENTWEKDNDHNKIDKSIQCITMKQIKKIKEWEFKNPHYLTNEKLLMEWHIMVRAIMGGSQDDELHKNKLKIKKNLSKVIKEI